MNQYEVTMLILVDPDAPFLGSLVSTHKYDIEDVLKETIYDLDDIEVVEIDVKEN